MKCPYCIKICNKCGRLLVANTMNFPKNKKCKYYVESECKKCRAEHYKQYYEDNKKKITEYHKQYYEDNKEELKEKNKQYREDNKEKLKEKNKQYREENKEKKSEYNKQYYEDNKEKKSDYNKQYYEDNKKKITEYHKQYYEENPHTFFNANNKRRQREENQGSGVTKEQWLEMMNFFDWCCAYSGVQLNKENRSIDHIISLVKGGLNEVWNCVPMLKNLNTSKYANDMLEWYTKQDFYSEERLNKIYEWQKYAFEKYSNQ